MPAGSLTPYDAYTVGYLVKLDARYPTNTFMVAHELAHVWQWQHRRLMAEWATVPCAVQPAWHCTAREAHADAVALAVLRAGCLPGDLGWPGGAVSGCTVPDPDQVRPPDRPP